MTGQLTDQFIQKSSLDALGADPRALGAVQWSRVATKENADGSKVTTGYHDDSGESRVISQVPAPEGFKAKEPKIKQVEENGTIYDVETREDGSEWLLGKQGQRGTAMMIKPPNAPDQEGIPAGKGETAQPESHGTAATGEEAPTLADFSGELSDTMAGLVQGVIPEALKKAEAAPREIIDVYRDESIPEPDRRAMAVAMGQKAGVEIGFRRIEGKHEFEPVVITPEMKAPGGTVGMIADAIGRLMGMNAANQVAATAGKAVEVAQAVRAGRAAPEGMVAASGGVGPRGIKGGVPANDTPMPKGSADVLSNPYRGAGKLQNIQGGRFVYPIEGGGAISGRVYGNVYKVQMSQALKTGTGTGTQAYENMANEILARGGTLESDWGITAAAARVYEKLKAKGFTVEKNPEARLEADGKMVADPKPETASNWVYRVTAAPKEIQAAIAEHGDWAAFKMGKPPGVDFNTANMNTTADAIEQLNSISKAYKPEIDAAKKGVIPLDVTRQVASLIGADEKAAEKAIKGLHLDTEDLHVRALVMRDALVASAENLDNLARRITSAEVLDSELLAFREAMIKHAALQANMKGVQTEIARALSAFRIPASGPIQQLEMTRELLDQMGGGKVSRDLAARWLSTPAEDKGKFVTRGAFAVARDAVFEIWINGLLSSFRTQEANFISTQAMMWLQVPERAIAGAIGQARQILPNANPDRVYMTEAVAMIQGYLEGIPSSAKLAWATFKSGTPSSAMNKVEAQGLEAITAQKFGLSEDSLGGRFVDYVGLGVRMPGRQLMTADEFNRGIGQQMQRRAIAYRQTQAALDNGATPEEAAALYKEIMQGGNAKANQAIAEFGDTVTFTKALGEAGQNFQKAANTVPGARLVVPFIRTPVNILKESGKRSPLAWVGSEVRADILAGGAKRDLALARISMGSAAMAWATSLAMEDRITGGGPKDPKLLASWLQKYQPYSVNIGSKEEPSWVSYKNIEPLATLLGVAANYTQVASWQPRDKDDDILTLAVAGTGAVLRDIADKAMLTAIGGFAKALDGEPGALERFMSGYARSVVPGSAMMNDIERAVDPTNRNTKQNPTEKNIAVSEFERMLNEVEAHTPGLSSDLPPQVYPFGEEKVPYSGDWWQAFNAFAPADKKPDAIINELTRLRMGLEPYAKDFDGAKLTPWQQYHHNQIANNFRVPEFDNMNMREYLNWLVQSPGYLGQISDNKKADILQDKHQKFLQVAEKMMLNPASKDFDADLYSRWVVATTLKPLGMKP